MIDEILLVLSIQQSSFSVCTHLLSLHKPLFKQHLQYGFREYIFYKAES